MELSLQGGVAVRIPVATTQPDSPPALSLSLSGTLHLPIKVNEPEVLHIFGHGPWDPNYVPTW